MNRLFIVDPLTLIQILEPAENLIVALVHLKEVLECDLWDLLLVGEDIK